MVHPSLVAVTDSAAFAGSMRRTTQLTMTAAKILHMISLLRKIGSAVGFSILWKLTAPLL
jgi:hypothetical protein